MRPRKSNIAQLAFMMLILFVSPMTVKAVHHHLPVRIPVLADPHGKSITAAAGACPLCQFEFVTFISFDNQEYSHYSQLSSLDCYEPTPGIKGNSFTCYSLRAPPFN
jgi:hypothetical protein